MARGTARDEPTTKVIKVATRGQVGGRNRIELFAVIGYANNLKLTANASYVEATGFASDIDLVEMLYASLAVQMSKATTAYLKAGTYKTELVYRKKTTTTTEPSWITGRTIRTRETDYGYYPVTANSARITFEKAFINRIGIRLAQAVSTAARDSATTGAELVLVARHDEVERYFNEKNPDLANGKGGTWKGSKGTVSRDAYIAGDLAGRRARLGTETAIDAARQALGA
jgi:hypothetical protein